MSEDPNRVLLPRHAEETSVKGAARPTPPFLRRLDWRRWPLFPRLTLIVTLAVVVTASSLTLLSMERERATFQAELEQQALSLLGTLGAASGNSLYSLDSHELGLLAERALRDEKVNAVRFYDPQGRILATSNQPRLERNLATNPLGETLINTEGTFLAWHDGYLTAGEAQLAGREVIGAISIDISTTQSEKKMIALRNQGLLAGGLSAVVGVFLALILARTFTQPIVGLITSTERIAQGDLSEPIPFYAGDDELSVLANSLERMRRDLKEMYGNLEQEVAARTEELSRANHLLRETNSDLIEAREKADEANRLKSQFLATMSHELRTPLNAINGFTQIMLAGMAGEVNDRQHTNLERTLANGLHLLTLINDILDLSKIETGNVSLIKKSMSVRQWLHGVEVETQSLAIQKGLEYRVMLDDRIPDSLVADWGRVKQIILNLISNAIKFTEKGRVDVAVRREGNERWLITVEDTGIGIPPHALEYVFDEFRQVDGSSSREHGGTGLGLAIVRKLAMLMGGQVRVESTVGVGSTFTVMLPLVVEQPLIGA